MDNNLKSAFMFLGGVAVGTMIGVLLAPDAGKKTRKKLVRQFDDLKDNLGEKFASGKSKLDNLKNEALSEAEKVSKRVSRMTE